MTPTHDKGSLSSACVSSWRVDIRDPHTPEWRQPKARVFQSEHKARQYAESYLGCGVGCQPVIQIRYRTLKTDGYRLIDPNGAIGGAR